MSVIRILPEAVANKIAAGEVVERPASVVKELLENSLDAGSERIEINVEAGGKRLIRVDDDGCGMNHDDALLAFERHATSKIRDAEDLFSISTLGFRGEALPSIAAVSRLTLESRDASEPTGTRLEIPGGRLRDVKEINRDRGTLVEARDLFFNTPARRKFLKSESTELGHVTMLVTHYALAHPEKSFRLTSLTNEIVNVTPVVTQRDRVYQLMGGQLLEQMVDISPLERRLPLPPAATGDQTEDEESLVRISGFVSRPEVHKLNRNNIYFFVNRRLVRDRLILHAVTEAYRNILPSSVFPVAMIFLQIAASEVDVNVHPSKTEVRFRNSSFIHDFVRDSIRQGLVAAQPIAAFPLPKRSGTGRADEVVAEAAEKMGDEMPVLRGPELPPLGGEQVPRPQRMGPYPGPGDFLLSSRRPDPITGNLKFEEAISAQIQQNGFHSNALAASASEFPTDLEPLGQVQESFIVATNGEGLWIIDQHVAHERILFERHLRARREKHVEGQRLLLPIVVELKPEQQVTFQSIAEELSFNGFEVEPFGQRTVAIKTAPADIRADDVERLLLEILESAGREAREISLEGIREKIAASVSCHAAIKINMALDPTKMEWLLQELARTDCPMTCPHGRPIVLRYSMKEIQKAFKRI
jgi:DNA mismatch repair protein MutL